MIKELLEKLLDYHIKSGEEIKMVLCNLYLGQENPMEFSGSLETRKINDGTSNEISVVNDSKIIHSEKKEPIIEMVPAKYSFRKSGINIDLVFAKVRKQVKEIYGEESYEYKNLRRLKTFPIDQMGFPTRTYNCLRKVGIDYLDQLINFDENKLMRIRGLGEKSCEQVKNKMIETGLYVEE